SSRKQLRALTVRLQSVREEERTHISREIHDDLGQALTGLRMDLVWITNKLSATEDPVSQRLKSMMQLTDTTIHKVRKIATDLRPGILDDIGLAAAIEWHAKDVGERFGIQFSFDLNEDIQLDEQRSTAFFRIFQESLTNVMRHAQAKHVHATLKRENNTIVMLIDDDGRGIAPNELSNPRSVGILGMKERAAFFGGEVNVIGVPNKGTTVRVRIPQSTS
ncbi:MAG: sensor histidine kinase, partial [Ignavibacteriales bacterium]|nr:sensor histidine kinase [Ignavibacteriales bacterium]